MNPKALAFATLVALVLPLPSWAVTSRDLLDAVQKNPENVGAWWKLGISYWKGGDFKNAAKAWNQVGKRKPALAKVQFMIGYACFKSKDYKQAARFWRQTLACDPDHPKAKQGLAQLVSKEVITNAERGPMPGYPPRPKAPKPLPPDPKPPETPKPEPAPPSPVTTSDTLASIQVTPDKAKADAAFEDGKSSLKFGQPDEAIQKFKDAFRFGRKRDDDIDYQLGKAYLEAEKPQPALFHLTKALEVNGEDQTIFLQLGKAYSLLNNTEKEISSYSRALEIDPEYGDAHFMLALAYDKVKNHPKTFEHAQRAIRIDPYFKEKLKPRIKDSNVAKRIGGIVTQVLEDSKYERLTDEKIEEYAEEIGRILGEENLNTEEFMGEGDSKDKVKGMLQDFRDGKGREAFDRIPAESRGKFLSVLRKRQGEIDPNLRQEIETNVRKGLGGGGSKSE